MALSKKQARNPTTKDILNIITEFNNLHVQYILIGGIALKVYGSERLTKDIDFIFPVSRDNGEKVKQALSFLEDHESLNIPSEWFEEKEVIRLFDEIVVDIMFQACGETYESLQPHIVSFSLDDVEIRTLDLEGLIKTKQLSCRDKDKMDIAMMKKALGIKH